MNESSALSPARSKDLRNRHPLYRRLSGESVWLFLEELGLDDAQCEAFMDAFFRQMAAVLSVMDRLENRSDLIGVVDGQPLSGCSCAGRQGCRLAWPPDRPGAPLPPYGVGCPLHVRVLPQDMAALPRAQTMSNALPPEGAPARSSPFADILCPELAASPHAALPHYLAQLAALGTDEKK